MSQTTPLSEKRCKPCEGDVPALTAKEVAALRPSLDADWTVSEDGKVLARTFEFPGYYRTMAFVNAVAWIAHVEGHHPDLEVGYDRCVARWTTHAVGGLTENDFICAAKVDRLVAG